MKNWRKVVTEIPKINSRFADIWSKSSAVSTATQNFLFSIWGSARNKQYLKLNTCFTVKISDKKIVNYY